MRFADSMLDDVTCAKKVESEATEVDGQQTVGEVHELAEYLEEFMDDYFLFLLWLLLAWCILLLGLLNLLDFCSLL